MNKSLIVLASVVVMLVGLPNVTLAQSRAASSASDNVFDQPWVSTAVYTLQKAGIVIGYPRGFFTGPPRMSRSEFAKSIGRLLVLLNADASSTADKDNLATSKKDFQNRLVLNPEAIAALQQLVNGFQPDLTPEGVDVKAVNASLDAFEAHAASVEAEKSPTRFGNTVIVGRHITAFPDVPPDYWAYQAILTLQKAGIVIGYPDGAFDGKQVIPH